MRVTVLGTGAALATGDRVQTGILLEEAEAGTTLLLDCGSGVLHRLAGIGCDPTEIDAVLLTHTHLDHVSDLPGLVKARWMADSSGTPIVGPPGTRQEITPLFELDDQSDRVDIAEFSAGDCPGDEVALDAAVPASLAVWATPTIHSRTGVAYRFGDRFGFSGDTEAAPALLEFFDGVDVLVHDCAHPPGGEPDNHPTPEALADALEMASPDIHRLYLTHLYPEIAQNVVQARDIVAEATDARVRVASDFSVVIANGNLTDE